MTAPRARAGAPKSRFGKGHRLPGLLLLILGSLGGTACAAAAEISLEGEDWLDLCDAIVQRMSLEPGERVLLIAEPGPFEPMIARLREMVRSSKGVDLGVVTPYGGLFPGEEATEFGTKLARLPESAWPELLEDVDLSVMMPGATADEPVFAALQNLVRAAATGDGTRMIHFHWEGAYGLDGMLLEPDSRVNELYRRAVFDTDYAQLARRQAAFERALRTGPVRVTTPAGTDLVFEVGERPVTRQDGDASAARARKARNLIDREVELPAGAIRVAPVEETVFGRVVFPDASWSGRRVAGLTLVFEAGHVVEIVAVEGHSAVVREMEAAGAAGRMFREFALGFNPLLAIPEAEPWIPYYGYGDGVVRLSLGDNTELGGAVGGGYVRWNFFVDASVYVGDEIWVSDGRLVP